MQQHHSKQVARYFNGISRLHWFPVDKYNKLFISRWMAGHLGPFKPVHL